MDGRITLGRRGEDLACRMFERLGFTVEDRNYRCALGEIDVVAGRRDLVVFCEVKTRTSDRFGDPAEAVNWRKQARLRRLAGHWLAAHPGPRRDVRFDVVSVVVGATGEQIAHLPDAF